ncbi:UDP-glucosyltransferase 29-like [Ziziphus jujuba]|uniref:Glycosyltransferase n=1 Tax=Ziziphus jujuba TaxID=326968 RepID=A0A6P3ZDY1_ZIZJJ|nr:UDP-glucosyltransferase 29-like [Ziziphus jujuba]
MVDATKRSVKVLMLPWLAHGHISPFLELAKKLTLTHRNFHIYLCSSPVNLDSIKSKLLFDPKLINSIELVELHLPELPELPPQNHTTKGLPPHLLPTLMKAFELTKSNLFNILETLKPDFIIHDFLPSWVPHLASSLNIPNIAFITSGASIICFSFHFQKNTIDEFPFPEICLDSLIQEFNRMRESSLINNTGGDPHQFYNRSCKIILIKSFRELEGKYMDYLSSSFGKKIVPVGPLVPDPVDDDEGIDIIKWLDKKEKSSTIFVSFGTECYLSKEDLEEMAHGLELSKVNFIWVVRFPEGEKVKLEDALPKGYLERVRDRGMIVENWAPQVKILNHPSIGGFLSHCGWGSFMESIKFGVPIIAMPMQFDQPLNARLAEICGIGLEIKRSKNNGGIEREVVAKVIEEVVVEERGVNIRKKTREMSDHIRMKGEEEIDGVVEELLKLNL